MNSKILQWYNWIPTNLGILDYNFITKTQMCVNFGKDVKDSDNSKDSKEFRFWNLNLKNFQDSLPSYLTISKTRETTGIGTISFIPSPNQTLQGLVTINYPKKFFISCEYNLEINGKVCIFNPSFGDFNQIKYIDTALLHTLIQMMYMILKQSLHGDSHHHQKIDYVLEVQQDIFPINSIIYTFAKHIKNVEKDIKSLDTCIGHLKAINAIEEVHGYVSYANTFYELNKDDISPRSKTLVKNMKNVVISLEATVAKKNNHFTYLDIAKTTFLTIFALILSLSLFLLKTFKDNIEITHDTKKIEALDTILSIPWLTLLGFVIILGLAIFYWLRKCYIKSYIFYKFYTLYEHYTYISWISLKDASFKYYILKIVFPLSIIILSLLSIYFNFLK